jgi:SAM-dependent methyltransferase
MPVWLAQTIVKKLTDPSELVLDPMLGSGTTATACLRAGRQVVGTDIDPMALLLARVATTAYDRPTATRRLSRILDGAERRIARGLYVGEIRETFNQEGQEFLNYWFSPRSQKQLFALKSEIAATPAGIYRDLAWVTLSSLIIAKAAGLSYAMDISRSRPHKVEDKPLPDGFEAWRRRSKIVLDRLPFTREYPPTVAASVRHADARKLPLADRSADLVLTSPPYLNAIDYMRTHKFSLIWMGHELSQLRTIRSGMVGTERGMYSPDSLPATLEGTIVESIDDATRLGLVRRYLSDLRRVLVEMLRVLKPGGAAVIALGPSLIARGEVDAGVIIGQLAESVGFQNVGWSFRPLEAGRRSLPPPTAAKRGNALGLRMEGEVFLGLLRP